MTAKRYPVAIEVLSGTFESQPLVYAHLHDIEGPAGATLELDAVEVICKADPLPRLAHYFTASSVDRIVDAMGLHTTLVLIFPEAGSGLIGATARLAGLGVFEGSRPLPG